MNTETPNVILSMGRYQELLQSESLFKLLNNARNMLTDYAFKEFCFALFPAPPKEDADA